MFINVRPENKRNRFGEIEGEVHNIITQNGAEQTIVARTTGDDVTGEGTLANPFRTFARAIQAVPTIIPDGERWFVDITGLGVELLPPEFQVPAFFSNGPAFAIDLTPVFDAFFFQSKVNIFALPSVVATITPAQVVSQVADPTTGLRTVTVTLIFAVNQHQGRFLYEPGTGIMAPISENGVSTLTLATTSAFPLLTSLQIIEPSVELRGTDIGTFSPGLNMEGIVASINWNGIKFRHADPNTFVASVAMSFCDVVNFIGCDMDGLSAFSGLQSEFMASCTVRNRFFELRGNASGIVNTAFINTPFTQIGPDGDRGVLQTFALRLLGTSGFGHTFANRSETFSWLVFSGHWKNSVGKAIQYLGGAHCTIDGALIEGSTSDALFAAGPGLIRYVNIAGAGNTGFGANVRNGCQLQGVTTNTVTGAGQVKVGVAAAGTWAALTSTFDEGAAGSTGARAFTGAL